MTDMVAAALADAKAAPTGRGRLRAGQPAEAAGVGRAFDQEPEETDAGALEPVLSSLGGAFERARGRDAVLAGFAEIDVETLYLGSSTGLRLSHVQPTAAVSLVGRTADGSGSAWVGVPAVDTSLEAMEQEIWRRLDWGNRQIALEAGRYEVILPPSGVADMMGMIGFDAIGGQDTEDGRTVFSKEGGGTRLGETITSLPFTLFSDPFAAGVECHAVRGGGRLELGGLGLRQRAAHGAHRLAARRRAHPPALPPGRRGAVRRCPWRPTSTTCCCTATATTADRSTTWWPAPSAGCC